MYERYFERKRLLKYTKRTFALSLLLLTGSCESIPDLSQVLNTPDGGRGTV